jgi:hypothetical protein
MAGGEIYGECSSGEIGFGDAGRDQDVAGSLFDQTPVRRNRLVDGAARAQQNGESKKYAQK